MAIPIHPLFERRSRHEIVGNILPGIHCIVYLVAGVKMLEWAVLVGVLNGKRRCRQTHNGTRICCKVFAR